MKVTLTQANIEAGILLFLQSQGLNPENATVEFAVTRKGGSQVVADVDLLGKLSNGTAPATAELAPVAQAEKPAKTKAEKVNPQPEPEPELVQEPEPVVETPVEVEAPSEEPAPVAESLFS